MIQSRPKQPELLRTRILAAAQQVLLDDGLAALTLDKVLARLDISKGGLQYHFRTKQQLLDGLFSQLFEDFAAEYKAVLAAEPEGPARHVRAYVQTARQSGGATREQGRAMTLLALGNPGYQHEWSDFLEHMFLADALDRGTQLACRLFADGLWFSLVIGPAPDEAALHGALERIHALTASPDTP